MPLSISDGKNPFTPSKLARSGEGKKSGRPTNVNVTATLGNSTSLNTSVASMNQTFTRVPAKKLTKKMEMAAKLPGEVEICLVMKMQGFMGTSFHDRKQSMCIKDACQRAT